MSTHDYVIMTSHVHALSSETGHGYAMNPVEAGFVSSPLRGTYPIHLRLLPLRASHGREDLLFNRVPFWVQWHGEG